MKTEFTKEQMAWMATGFFMPDQLRGLTPDQLRGLTPYQLSGLTPYQLRGLTPDQLRGLTPDQLRGLTPYQLRGLTPDQLSVLTPDQLSVLTRDQLRGLTPYQLRVLELLKNAPKVERLYSGILADIRASRRRLDQNTFGPEEGVDEPNLCNTPMCIAGHTVNRAGAAGLELKRRLGFASAAMAIHLASRPDAPVPRYDSYPDEWALAFIETRAAEEEEEAQG